MTVGEFVLELLILLIVDAVAAGVVLPPVVGEVSHYEAEGVVVIGAECSSHGFHCVLHRRNILCCSVGIELDIQQVGHWFGDLLRHQRPAQRCQQGSGEHPSRKVPLHVDWFYVINRDLSSDSSACSIRKVKRFEHSTSIRGAKKQLPCTIFRRIMQKYGFSVTTS